MLLLWSCNYRMERPTCMEGVSPRAMEVAQLVKDRLQCRRLWFDFWVGRIPWRMDRIRTQCSWSSLVTQMVKNLPAVQQTSVRSLDWENPLEEGMATTQVFLPGEPPWTEEPGGLQRMESQKVRHDWTTKHTKNAIRPAWLEHGEWKKEGPKAWVCHPVLLLLAVWPWGVHLNFLSSSFLIWQWRYYHTEAVERIKRDNVSSL